MLWGRKRLFHQGQSRVNRGRVTDNTRISSLVNQPRLSCLQHDYSNFLHIYTTMTDNEPNTVWNTNLPADPRKRRLSMWFVNNQKSEAWDKKAMNTLHILIVVLLVLVYACHVIGSPFIRFVDDHTALTVIYILETLFLVISILCFVKMCFVNGVGQLQNFCLIKQASGHIYLRFG